jgi:hypothetical protein
MWDFIDTGVEVDDEDRSSINSGSDGYAMAYGQGGAVLERRWRRIHGVGAVEQCLGGRIGAEKVAHAGAVGARAWIMRAIWTGVVQKERPGSKGSLSLIPCRKN